MALSLDIPDSFRPRSAQNGSADSPSTTPNTTNPARSSSGRPNSSRANRRPADRKPRQAGSGGKPGGGGGGGKSPLYPGEPAMEQFPYWNQNEIDEGILNGTVIAVGFNTSV